MSVLVSTAASGAWAWAGLRLEPQPSITDNGAHVGLPESQRRVEAASLEQVWLSRQWEPDGRAFELRYANVPGGGVTCALFCRARGSNGPSASAAALSLREALRDVPRHVRAEPIDDVGELHAALVPFPSAPSGLVEVRKRVVWAWLHRRDTDFPLGVAFVPLLPEAVSWEPVWEALARANVPTAVSICVEPYTPPPELIDHLRRLTGEYGRLAQPGRPNPVFVQYVPPDPFAQRATALCEAALHACANRGYRLRISLAAAGPQPLHLAELIAATVSSPTGVDGGAVARTVAPHESAHAWGNVTGLQHTWLDTTYRQEVPRPLDGWGRILADLVDVPQASAAFRFPYEIPGRPPLFATARRGTGAPPSVITTASDGRDPQRDPHIPDL
ncbi:hypothetical protein [Streptomyces formicae]|uniref:Uncharacterized protein n=1 Tax=Streptomyces formicae TaxID=1616117 RepID=A0ABY3WLG9_9ACTN|nr:hypothetical protein [Streptomyces formicae]UNM12431.1 hypothetical protein J4032_13600 [Streptomyces formicae]